MSAPDTERLKSMAHAAEKFEDEVLGLKPMRKPESLPEAVELFMYENKLSQARLADQLV